LPPKSIELVITDPPFGIDFKENLGFYNRKSSNVVAGYKEIYSFCVKFILVK